MFQVVEMSDKDLEFAVNLTDQMNWGMIEEDFRFMMKLEPEGCFILRQDSERIGLATTISFGKIGWFGNLIVSENHRKKGAGSLLVKHSIKYLKKKNVETVGLYAYIDRIPFYRQLGFEYESDFIVLNGKGFSSQAKTNSRKVGKEDIQRIIDYDFTCFGAYRTKLLGPILLNLNNLCYIYSKNKQTAGYIAAKVYTNAGLAYLGPLICEKGNKDVAIDLLKTILGKLNGFDVSIYVPEKESAILNMLIKSGFKEDFHVARMFLGSITAKDCICTAESLERG